MSDERFERLKKIAKDEFGVTISRSDKKSSFHELFGGAMMIDKDMAKKIGRDACIEKMGKDFVEAHKGNAVFACGLRDEAMYCFVGVSDKEDEAPKGSGLTLDSTSQWPYRVGCFVSLSDGAVTWSEVVVPEKK